MERIVLNSGSGQRLACAGPRSIISEWTTLTHMSLRCVSSILVMVPLWLLTSYSPQSCHTLQVDRDGMGREIHPKFKKHNFGSCKYTYQLIVCHTKTYLTQMRQYRTQMSSTRATERSKSPVHPVPPARGQVPPTRFQFKRPTYEPKTSLQEFTVDAEYRMYVSGHLTSPSTGIMTFWEVRFMLLGGAITHTLIGQ